MKIISQLSFGTEMTRAPARAGAGEKASPGATAAASQGSVKAPANPFAAWLARALPARTPVSTPASGLAGLPVSLWAGGGRAPGYSSAAVTPPAVPVGTPASGSSVKPAPVTATVSPAATVTQPPVNIGNLTQAQYQTILNGGTIPGGGAITGGGDLTALAGEEQSVDPRVLRLAAVIQGGGMANRQTSLGLVGANTGAWLTVQVPYQTVDLSTANLIAQVLGGSVVELPAYDPASGTAASMSQCTTPGCTYQYKVGGQVVLNGPVPNVPFISWQGKFYSAADLSNVTGFGLANVIQNLKGALGV
jgi:hypothetical protein